MATLSFSQQALDNFYYNMQYYFFNGGSSGNYHFIRLMSGTMPTDFSTLTTSNSLSSQILWEHPIHSTDRWFNTKGDNYMTLNTTHTTAQSTGTAEWFWYLESQSNTPQTGAHNIDFQFIGSVGTVGTDLLVGSTSITSGKYYRVTGLKLSLSATEYTW